MSALKKHNEEFESEQHLAQPETEAYVPHEEVEEGEPWLISYADLMTLLVGFFALIMSFSKMDPKEYEKVKEAASTAFGGEYQKPHQSLKDQIEKVLNEQGIKDKFEIVQTDAGVEVTFRGQLFFESGSAELRDEAVELMSKVAPVIKQSAKDYAVIVEGHTDDNPISSPQFPSNWELSSARASRVVRIFESHSFDRTHLQAIGWADTKPLVPNRDEKGSAVTEHQSQNRRVIIKIMKI